MKQVRCPNCGFKARKHGKTKAGKQRWLCINCNYTFCNQIDSTVKDFQSFLNWLFSKTVHKDMPGEGRTFRRRTAKFWLIWPMPPKVEEPRYILFVDGIHLGRKACILICSDGKHVLGWYACRNENTKSWMALMQRIAAPKVVVSDGGSGFWTALRKVWPTTRLQRCTLHAFWQVKRYTTRQPKSLAGLELLGLAHSLLHIENQAEAQQWIKNILAWRVKHRVFLAEMTKDEKGKVRPTHERLIKAENSLVRLIKARTLFTYLDEDLDFKCASTNNAIEGGVNAQIRELLRHHRGLTIDKRIKAVFWWCYKHSPKPLSPREILAVMPTDSSISKIYNTMNSRSQLEGIIPTWGDAIVWSDLHHCDKLYNNSWD